MFVLQICIGVLTAVGLALVLADIYHLPTLKARKATNNLGKKGDKKVSIVEIYLKDFSAFLSKKIKLNEYKRAQLEVDLKTAGMETSPEAYVADAITKALVIALFALLVFFFFKILSVVVLFVSVIVYFKEYQAVSVKIKSRRQKIEYELPRFVSAIEKTMQHNRSIVYILESYKDTAVAERIQRDVLEKLKVKPVHVDGSPESGWIIVDFGSVMVHVMTSAAREMYQLEDLWSDAPQLDAEKRIEAAIKRRETLAKKKASAEK